MGIKEDVEKVTPTYELPFYIVEMRCPHYKIFNKELDKDWSNYSKAEAQNRLRDIFPKYEHPIAAQFVNRKMIENSLWAEADENGYLATDDPTLAAYALRAAQRLDPKARMHPFSKKLTEEDFKRADALVELPGPRKYNLKPKNQLKIS